METKINNIKPEEHLGLVGKVVARYIKDRIPLEDSEEWSDGVVGLLRAAERFKPELGFKFSTYAVKLITNEVKSGLRTRYRKKKLKYINPEKLDIPDPTSNTPKDKIDDFDFVVDIWDAIEDKRVKFPDSRTEYILRRRLTDELLIEKKYNTILQKLLAKIQREEKKKCA